MKGNSYKSPSLNGCKAFILLETEPSETKRPHAHRMRALTRTVTIGSLTFHTHPSYIT